MQALQKQVDLVYRLAYRLAYPIARRWWRLYGRHHGVSIAVWLGDTVLAVHHSYKPGLRLPGGGVAWREDHHKAAVRELREEVGVTLDPAQLRLVASGPTPFGFFHLYEARVEAMPELVIDRREITEARFVRPTLLHEMRYRNGVGAYLHHALEKLVLARAPVRALIPVTAEAGVADRRGTKHHATSHRHNPEGRG